MGNISNLIRYIANPNEENKTLYYCLAFDMLVATQTQIKSAVEVVLRLIL